MVAIMIGGGGGGDKKPPAPQDFKSLDGNQFTRVARYFDANHDGKLSQDEMNNAANLLHMIGTNFKNQDISNYGDAFARLNYEVAHGNRAVDVDGDGQLQIDDISNHITDPTSGQNINNVYPLGGSELAQIIARNDSTKLEVADLQAAPKTDFKNVNGDLARTVFSLFDKNNDGNLSTDEMTNASTVLNKIGKLLNNDAITNLANVFTRLTEEVKAGNRAVDEDGDGMVRYRVTVPNYPPGTIHPDYVKYQPNELDDMIGRNDPNALETLDLQKPTIYPVITTGVVAKPASSNGATPIAGTGG